MATRFRVALYWSDGHHVTWPDLLSPFGVRDWRTLMNACATSEHGELTRIELTPAPTPRRPRCPSNGRPPLTEDMIVMAARAWLAEHGSLPSAHSGDAERHFAHGQPETWRNAHEALACGLRGLRGGDSLASLLQRHGLVRAPRSPRIAGEDEVWLAACAHHKRHGRWPSVKTPGPVSVGDQVFRDWRQINNVLRAKPGQTPDSLSRLLQRRGATFVPAELRPVVGVRLTEEAILAAAQQFRARTGGWPTSTSGDARLDLGVHLKWMDIDSALKKGLRGLPGRSSLSKLLAPLKATGPSPTTGSRVACSARTS